MLLVALNTLPFSWLVLLTLWLMLAASVATLTNVIRRCTTRRSMVALEEWGRENRFRIQHRSMMMPPPPFATLRHCQPRSEFEMASGRTVLLQLHTAALQPLDTTSATVSNVAGMTMESGSVVWHLLIRRIRDEWPPTGLRPTDAANSVLDLFDLPAHPMLGNPKRFITHGVDVAAARQLTGSFARALLPPDIGLLLHGYRLIIDFSGRPFDTTELNRIIALADQVAESLPGSGG